MQFFKVKTVEETFALIAEQVPAIKQTETRALDKALHYILAEPVIAEENVPGFDRSTVDGYAVRAKDTYGSSESMPGFLALAGEVHMGEVPTMTVSSGTAVYVPTGGMLPAGSDAVIMIEHCEDVEDLLNTYKQVAPGENVIRKGEDIREGEILLAAGTKLRPQELGALASLGITHVTVFRKITAGYLSSGDEIVPYQTETLQVGQIRDINYLTIAGLASDWNVEVVYGGIVKDDFAEFQQKAFELYQQCDCLILSGGSSVGAKDYTTDVIQSLGDPGVFVHGISIKPGKPTILAVADGKPVIGLPGHPASAMIIFKLFGERILRTLTGEVLGRKPERIFAKITKNIPSSPGRSDYIRVRLFEQDGDWWAEPIIGKSGLITTLVKSDGIVEISSEKEGVSQGEYVPVIPSR
ncbi:molybdopterin molybdotransferase MoeA [Neobacillus vireti]|uniref:Molybdopterin molybdenumtransferase n=1 Tax=Neobacillus vireti LMG 21834 TaxID=1131730 RepID=A0AB94IL01_9BACI|nr:gephyrin-like molybdotransferase Glp [Neobacillus vireti]ETI67687.1 molybdenum cofactor synthesis domain-containing protein [Neobacillus vireti LMG 21834]KLT16684.1 molybdenum cofactor biosynthesis protein [Neobacillus vireti]